MAKRRHRSRKKPKGSLTDAARHQANSRAGRSRREAGTSHVFNTASQSDLPPKVRRCRAARHAICEELFSALRCEDFPWLPQPRGLADVFQTVAAVSATPVEHYKRSWSHAAERAAAEGFRFEAVPAGDRRNGKDASAYILCDHDACLGHGRNAVAVIVSGDIALEGLDLSGLVPEMDESEHCAHRRRSILASKLPELCAEDRFVVPAGIKLPPGLALHAIEDGAGVSIECEHLGCAAAGTQEIEVLWDPRMPHLARTSILVRNV